MHAKSLQSYLTLRDPVNCSLLGLFCPWDSPSKNIGAGYHFLLQEISPTQGLNHASYISCTDSQFFITSAAREAPQKPVFKKKIKKN